MVRKYQHMRSLFSTEEMRTMEFSQPFAFSKDCPLMKIVHYEDKSGDINITKRTGTRLYDLEIDPKQENPIQDSNAERKMISYMVQLMNENDSPAEQFERMGLTKFLK